MYDFESILDFLYVKWLVVRVERKIEIWVVRMDFCIGVRIDNIIYSKYDKCI